MKNIAMKNIARFLIACAFVGSMVGCSTRVNVSETYINESINEAPQTQIVQGALQSAPIPPLQSAPLQIINANDKSVIDANDFANTQYVLSLIAKCYMVVFMMRIQISTKAQIGAFPLR